MIKNKQQCEAAGTQLDELPTSFLTNVVRSLDPASRLALLQCSTGCMQAVASSCQARLQVLVHAAPVACPSKPCWPPQPWGVPRLLARLTQPYQRLHLQICSCSSCAQLHEHQTPAQLEAPSFSFADILNELLNGGAKMPNTARVVKLTLTGFTEVLPELLTLPFAKAFPNLQDLHLQYTSPTPALDLCGGSLSEHMFLCALPHLSKLAISRPPSQHASGFGLADPCLAVGVWPSSAGLKPMLPNLTTLELSDLSLPPSLISAWSDQLTSLLFSCKGMHSACLKSPSIAQLSDCHNLRSLSLEHYGYEPAEQQEPILDPNMASWPGALDLLTTLNMPQSQMLDVEIELLLKLPELRHVTVAAILVEKDLTSIPCKWQSFYMVDNVVSLLSLSRLPLNSLKSPLIIGFETADYVQVQLPDVPFVEARDAVKRLLQQVQHVGISFKSSALAYGVSDADADHRVSEFTSDFTEHQLAELITMLSPCLPRQLQRLELANFKVTPVVLQSLAQQHHSSLNMLSLIECDIKEDSDEFWAAVLQFPNLHRVELEGCICIGLELDSPHYDDLVGTALWHTCLFELKEACYAVGRQLTALQQRRAATGTQQGITEHTEQQQPGTLPAANVAEQARAGSSSNIGPVPDIDQPTPLSVNQDTSVGGEAGPSLAQVANMVASASSAISMGVHTALPTGPQTGSVLSGAVSGGAHSQSMQEVGSLQVPGQGQWDGPEGRKLQVSLFPPPFSSIVVEEQCQLVEEAARLYKLHAAVEWDEVEEDRRLLQLNFAPCTQAATNPMAPAAP